MGKKLDFTGQTIGKLTVTEKAQSDSNATYWYCVCKCGKNVKLSTRKLNSGKTKDCGYCTKTRRDKSKFIK